MNALDQTHALSTTLAHAVPFRGRTLHARPGPPPCAPLRRGGPRPFQALFCADAQHLPLADKCVDLVVTSPPYWALRIYGHPNEIGGETSPGAYIQAMTTVLNELQRVLTPSGNVFMIIGDKYARTGGIDRKSRGTGPDPGGRRHQRPSQRGVPGIPDGSLVGLPARLAIAAVDRGWLWRQNIVWAKPNPLPESVQRRCTRTHETVLHLSLTAQHYCRPTNRGGELGHDVWPVAVQGYRDPNGTPTPAVFPVQLAHRIIRDWCPPGGLVLDPFVGSGTTAIAARTHDVRCVGIDLLPEMVAAADRRISRTRP